MFSFMSSFQPATSQHSQNIPFSEHSYFIFITFSCLPPSIHRRFPFRTIQILYLFFSAVCLQAFTEYSLFRPFRLYIFLSAANLQAFTELSLLQTIQILYLILSAVNLQAFTEHSLLQTIQILYLILSAVYLQAFTENSLFRPFKFYIYSFQLYTSKHLQKIPFSAHSYFTFTLFQVSTSYHVLQTSFQTIQILGGEYKYIKKASQSCLTKFQKKILLNFQLTWPQAM